MASEKINYRTKPGAERLWRASSHAFPCSPSPAQPEITSRAPKVQ